VKKRRKIFETMKFIVAILFISIVYSKDCNDGPAYWCLDDATAKECGAISFCEFENKFLDPIKIEKTEENIEHFHTKDENKAADAAPVNVTLYYESLCPSCKQILLNQIWPSFEKLQGTGILNVKLVPYGNAQQRLYGNQWVFYCQHGPTECTGNILESCAMYHYPKQEQHLPFIHCLEYYGPYSTNAQYCASLAKLNYNAIYTCSVGEEGNKIEHQMGVETEALNPPHQYVPWFTMNGYHSQTIQNQLSSNFLNYVCQTYTGTKPKGCYASEPSVCKRNTNEKITFGAPEY